jgi:hypothetical protein
MVANPRLTSLRGLAVSGDGKNLYFTDYALGVFGVDLVAGTAFDVVHDGAKVPLGGIDGLYWYDNTLVVHPDHADVLFGGVTDDGCGERSV